MGGQKTFNLILVLVGLMQFLIVPIFTSQALGGKVFFFSLFVVMLTIWGLLRKKELCLPVVLLPLFCLAATFLISSLNSTLPQIGIIELGTFSFGLLFCSLIANLSCDYDLLQRGVFTWLRVVGTIIAILCFYQYIDWQLFGQKSEVLIPYLLPPGYVRVNGVYGQSNLTALLMVLSIIAFLPTYLFQEKIKSAVKRFGSDAGLLCVSTAFFLTGSRAGMLSLILAAMCLMFVVSRRRHIYPASFFLRPCLILICAFAITQIPSLLEVSSSSNVHVKTSVDARFVFWMVSFLMFLDYPWLGVGLDNFKLHLPSYSMQAHDLLGFVEYEALGYSSWSHSEFFQLLAESGIIGFSLLGVFIVMLFRTMSKEFYRGEQSRERIFLFLLIIPFLCQGMLSWPFRHPALLSIFFLILGVILAKTSVFTFRLLPPIRILALVVLLAALPAICYVAYEENRFARLVKDVKEDGCTSPAALTAMEDPYLGFKAQRQVLPLCVADKSFQEDKTLVEQFKPYFEQIADIQGTHTQWYNLGLVYRSIGESAQAKLALKKSVERQPVFELGWKVLHTLNIEEAVQKTGKPIESFLPPQHNDAVNFYDSIFQDQ